MFRLTRALISTASLVCRRSMMTTPALRGDQRSLIKLKQLQSDYQCDDGKPIFLKAGFRDRVLYVTTWVLAIIGILGVLDTIYQNAKPASWRTPAC
ncbi:hypothetical protein NE865_08736 [Phthorimaea operculella]|nr:hypothetical protein NE865_08736 [Phthorimaea operculella]